MPIHDNILAIIKKNIPTIILLDLHHAFRSTEPKLMDEDMSILVATLTQNKFIERLHLDFNAIGDRGAEILAQGLTQIQYLQIRDNQIGSVGAKALAGNPYLKTLNIASNKIGDEGVQAFIHNTTLTKLNISNNQVTSKGFAALTKNHNLTCVYFINNPIRDIAVQSWLTNHTLTKTVLEGSFIHAPMQNQLKAKLAQNKVLAAQLVTEQNPRVKANLKAFIKYQPVVVPTLLELGFFAIKQYLQQGRLAPHNLMQLPTDLRLSFEPPTPLMEPEKCLLMK